MSISVGILVKNDSGLLRECLGNLVSYFSDIVVIDNGSSDDSADVARSFNCRVIDAHEDAFDAARNRYLEQADSDWVLFIDTDERITKSTALKVHEAINSAEQNLLGCYMPRFEYIGQGKWTTTWVLRLFRVHSHIRYPSYRALHTSVRDSINELGGETRNIYAQIHHLDILLKDRAASKRKRYVEHLLTDIRNGNYDNTSYYYLGLEYTAIGEYEQAEKCYRTSSQMNSSNHFPELFLAQQYLHQKRYEESRREAESLLNENARIKVPALVVLAELAVQEGSVEEAIRCCLEAIELAPLEPSAHLNLASLLETSDPLQSIYHLSRAVDLNPYLLNHQIYGKGEQPNLYQHQISFISSFRSVFEHMETSYMAAGEEAQATYWLSKHEEISQLNLIGGN